jgi:excisionase family DNA binding protein
MNPKEIDHELLTIKEICDLLQVHQSTIYKMVRQGKIPSFRVGSDWRFRKDLIERWMAEKSTAARQVRKVIESGVSGGIRRRSMAGSRGPKR